MQVKEQTIYIDGLDKSGKDTIRDILIKKTNGRIFIVVRCQLSQIVYSRIKRRNINEKFFINDIVEDSRRGRKIFVLTANDNVIKERCKMTGERDISASDVKKHKKQFFKLIDELKSKVNITVIDTSYDTPEQSAKKILEILR